MLPPFLPEGVTIELVTQAMAGVTIFSAAYLAENVRGGLQATPLWPIRVWQIHLHSHARRSSKKRQEATVFGVLAL